MLYSHFRYMSTFPVFQTWRPHIFVLNGSKLYYTEETQPDQEDDMDDDEAPEDVSPWDFWTIRS